MEVTCAKVLQDEEMCYIQWTERILELELRECPKNEAREINGRQIQRAL